ncbi:hypothetical protein KDRO_E04150 [Kluyveromyces lactis]|nr:hypothetical protein KDRO_E04150 [Kluyveromyces lactis]
MNNNNITPESDSMKSNDNDQTNDYMPDVTDFDHTQTNTNEIARATSHAGSVLSRVASYVSRKDRYIDENGNEVWQDDEVSILMQDEETPDFTWKNIRRYAITRLTTLTELHRVSMENINPIPELRKMTLHNWNYFFMGYAAWLCAAWAFFAVSVSTAPLAALYGKATKDISWGLSLVLFVRSAGAIIFGIWTDNYSRKWPYITCLGLFLICQLCTPWAKTYTQFLGVRWISGIAMGGIYACASATAIEDAPVKARSFLSGLFFTAYAMGFIFAIIFYRAFLNVNGESYWKVQFWFSIWLPAVLILWRLVWPETKYFTKVLKARQLMRDDAIAKNGGQPLPKLSFKQKFSNVKKTVSKYWLLFGYLILLLVGPNYLTHASQDLFPTMLRAQLRFSEDAVTVAVVVVCLGSITGGMFFGQLMEITGRRVGLLLALVMAGCFTYPAFMLKTSSAVLGAGFMLWFSIFGVWGVLPIHLSELSPPEARALVSGLAYQLGNLASAASVVIENDLADLYPIEWNAAGEVTNKDYSKVMAILTGSAVIFTFVLVFVGHEKFHRDLSSPHLKSYIERVDQREEVAAMTGSTANSISSKPNDDQLEKVSV